MTQTSEKFIPERFVYGECVTDHKDGEGLNDVFDYFNHRKLPDDLSDDFAAFDQPIFDFVRDSFRKLGLRFPMPENVYHGSNHELLFLDSHGIVIRTGRNDDTDPRNFLHPHLLQPLGWITSKEHDVTIALYPAVHLFGYTPLKTVSAIENALKKNHFEYDDLRARGNIGYLKLGSSEENNFPLGIDLSTRVSENIMLDPQQRKTYNAFRKALKNQKPFEALKVLFKNKAGSPYSTEQHAKAFNFHQPLRHAFFRAWPNAHENQGNPDPKCMKQFWEMARSYVENGYSVLGKSEDGKKVVKSKRQTPIPWAKKY